MKCYRVQMTSGETELFTFLDYEIKFENSIIVIDKKYELENDEKIWHVGLDPAPFSTFFFYKAIPVRLIDVIDVIELPEEPEVDNV